MKILINLKIIHKISIGFGLCIFLLLTVAMVSVCGLYHSVNLFLQYRALMADADQLGRVEEALLKARIDVEHFLLTTSPESIARVTAQASAAIQRAKEAESLAASNEERAKVAGVADKIEQFSVTFAKAVALQKTQNESAARLFQYGATVLQDLDDLAKAAGDAADSEAVIRLAAIQRGYMLTRLFTTQYVASHDQQQAREAERQAQEVRDAMSSFSAYAGSSDYPEWRGTMAAVQEGFHRYLGEVKTHRQTATERDDLIRGTMDGLGAQIETAVEQVKVDLKTLQDDLGREATTTINRSAIACLTVSVLAIVFALLSAVAIGRVIAHPILTLAEIMRRLATHDVTASADRFAARHDEIGVMARSVQGFRDSIMRADELTVEQERQRETRLARALRVDGLTRSFEAAVAGVLTRVSTSADDLHTTSGTMSSIANQAATQTATVAAAAQQVSTNVQTLASASEQLAASISEVGLRTTQAKAVAEGARAESDRMNSQVRALAEAATRIGEVVNTISAVAAQTNLLALNATIEAARAGEAGKGFAVVATEVKLLATQTRLATEDITHQIYGVQDLTRGAVEAIGKIAAIVGRVSETSNQVAASLEEQGAATVAISRSVQQAANGTNDVTANIVGIMSAAQKTGDSASQVLTTARTLSGQTQTLQDVVADFLENVKAA